MALELTDRVARRIARSLLGRDEVERLETVPLQDEGHGYDIFGAHRATRTFFTAAMAPIYDKWFRVEAFGRKNIPSEGPVVIAANHSGAIPMDAAMVLCDLNRFLDPPRLVRPLADHFVRGLPLAGALFARFGVVGGSRRNADEVLRRGGAVLVFPEGVPGIGKNFNERYQLKPFRRGHAELALRNGAPIVPTAVVGAEEQYIQVAKLPGIMGTPHVPITPFFPLLGPVGLVPLPVKYRIYYGEPIYFHERYERRDADDPEVLMSLAAEVQGRVAELIEQGLDERNGWFG